jgi:hypothetical protein
MKVLFLDHDGVMCTANEFGSRHKKRKKLGLSNIIPINYIKTTIDFDDFNIKCVVVLNEIISVTNCKIVITSDWRNYADINLLTEIYKEQGIIEAPYDVTRIVDFMSDHDTLESNRVYEIQRYLADHPEITSYCVVDDLLMNIPNFVYCGYINEGIKQSGIKDKIIKILNL